MLLLFFGTLKIEVPRLNAQEIEKASSWDVLIASCHGGDTVAYALLFLAVAHFHGLAGGTALPV